MVLIIVKLFGCCFRLNIFLFVKKLVEFNFLKDGIVGWEFVEIIKVFVVNFWLLILKVFWFINLFFLKIILIFKFWNFFGELWGWILVIICWIWLVILVNLIFGGWV